MKRCLTSGRKCNRCVLEEFRRAAKESNQELTLRPKPTKAFPNGQDVFVGGSQVGWLGSVPEYCDCR